MMTTLEHLAIIRSAGTPVAIASVCSAHPLVLRATLRHACMNGTPVLIEATCNQVNHKGGYTGMRPADFAALVRGLAEAERLPFDRVILGGDHLGPNPWRNRTAEEALTEAEAMVACYVAAGFRKIHLDASMRCAGDPAELDDRTIAERVARLARVAEATALGSGENPPVYIIGSEVPSPGGANHVLDQISPTGPEAARNSIKMHQKVFEAAGLADAFRRVIGVVVQPGVEFGNQNVIFYDPSKARALVRVLYEFPGLVFEAHSTDYQGFGPLEQLVQDGFAILKVGPELTFVLREALYALDLIASDLLPDYGSRPLYETMERLMLKEPQYWKDHYFGDEAELRALRHYSFSDRIRYYWTEPEARAACERLFSCLAGMSVPVTLLAQHMPDVSTFADTPLDPAALVVERIEKSLKTYAAACSGNQTGWS